MSGRGSIATSDAPVIAPRRVRPGLLFTARGPAVWQGAEAIQETLGNIGALITIGLGLMGLLLPSKAASFANVQPIGTIGISEIRATYGGLFVALGLACAVTQHPGVFLAAGLAWVGAAVGRLVSVAVDGSRSPKNLGGIAFELAIGLLLLAPWWGAA